MTTQGPKTAIIGAGISALACARQLADCGLKVVIFEKSRGVGGRMATRRIEGGLQFDHGAQYFTARDPTFWQHVQSWLSADIIAPWEGRLCTLARGQVEWKDATTVRYVGIPGMNAICKHLAKGLDIHFSTRVLPPAYQAGLWRLEDDRGHELGDFDCFLTSAPAPQSAELLAGAPALQRHALATRMNGCWAGMLAFDQPLQLPFDGAFVHESLLSWIARNDTKPQRTSVCESWVLHASAEWTEGHLDDPPETVLPQLVEAFWQATQAARQTPSFATAHGWRYAIPPEPLADRYLYDADLRMGACGDWCSGPRVEGAFLSGLALAAAIQS